MDSIRVSLCVWHYSNNDGEDSNEPYSYRGTTGASLESIRATVGEWKGDFHHAREEIPSNFNPRAGMLAYVVLVHYYTGDTFGSDDRIIPVAAFETQEKADALVRLIESDNLNNRYTYDNLKIENVEVYSGAWKGYFEGINRVDVQMVPLEP